MSIMNKNELKSILVEEVAVVTFTKVDGSERILKCTLDPSYLPVVEIKENSTKKDNPDVLSVWDIENSGWRSFKLSSVKSIEV